MSLAVGQVFLSQVPSRLILRITRLEQGLKILVMVLMEHLMPTLMALSICWPKTVLF